MPAAPTPRPPSLTERTIEAVRDGIRNGTFVPGELYSVYQLADRLAVSRSPVREALLR
ncbi:GntR family transcriptional regulator, partial [Arthrobacter sp. 35/47]